MDFSRILNFSIKIGNYSISVEDVILALLAILVAKVLLWTINNLILRGFFHRKKIDSGRQYALKQFISYIIWTLVIFVIIEIFGVTSMIWAGLAALLVGIGFGIQDIFKDVISGIVILIEGTIEVGDIIEIEGMVATVTNIGIRTSYVETRDRVSILIPNSKLIINQVTNWTHNEYPNRFLVSVGVAYGSDLFNVKELIIQAATEHPKVEKDPSPSIQFTNFGDSSLDFDLYFFSKEAFGIEYVKSDIRFSIDRLFRENNIQIPFPQRDVWLRDTKKKINI